MNMSSIVFATTNYHKELIFQKTWSHAGLDEYGMFQTLNDFEGAGDIVVPEDTGSFVGDALQKARVYAQYLGRTVISQDRGFGLDALNGWPGTDSKEVMDPGKHFKYSKEVIQTPRLLEEYNRVSLLRARQVLSRIEGKDRGMTVTTAYALCTPDGKEMSYKIVTHGTAAFEPVIQWENSFSSFFIPEGYNRILSTWDTKEEIEAYWATVMCALPGQIREYVVKDSPARRATPLLQLGPAAERGAV